MKRKLLSTKELAAHFKVKPATIAQWKLRYEGFPEPGYDVEEVEKFLAKRRGRNERASSV